MNQARSSLRYARIAATCLAATLLMACFEANKPIDSTQTGNPPIIDSARIGLKILEAGLHVTGSVGAVSPGATKLEITNLNTGETISTKAQADGSFDSQVAGTANDVFEVRAQGHAESAAVYVVKASAAASGMPEAMLTCEQRSTLVGSLLQQVATGVDQRCTRDSDCEVVRANSTCANQCEYAIASPVGRSDFEASSAAITMALCDSCTVAPIPCPLQPKATCINRQCARSPGMTSLTCDERAGQARETLGATLSMADTQCSVASDCVEPQINSVCTDDCGGHEPVSRMGDSSVKAAVAAVESGVCATFRADGCNVQALPCVPPQPNLFVCADGHCARGSRQDAGMPDCVTCLEESLQWGYNGGFVAYFDWTTLAPCVHYTRQRRGAGSSSVVMFSCQTDLMACNAITSSGAVLSALNNADVQQALAQSPVLYGTDTRPVDGSVFQVNLGSKRIEVGGSCEGAPPNCIPAPSGVQALVKLLQDIDTALAQTPDCQQFKQ